MHFHWPTIVDDDDDDVTRFFFFVGDIKLKGNQSIVQKKGIHFHYVPLMGFSMSTIPLLSPIDKIDRSSLVRNQSTSMLSQM